MTMLAAIVKKLKGILPEETWDFIFGQFLECSVKFSHPPYSAVRVSKNYMLVRVPGKKK